MSFFFSTYNLQLSKNFPVGPTVQDVLNVLHDPQQVARLSKIVYSVAPDPTRGENDFIVKERVPLIGRTYLPITFKLKWTRAPDGCDMDVEADLWTKLVSRMRVKVENGVVVFREDLTAEVILSFI